MEHAESGAGTPQQETAPKSARRENGRELNVVLFEPEIPQNTGNVARTCAATGARLHLVKPFGFEITDRNLKRAGLDYWYLVDITYYDSIDDFFEKTQGGEYFFFSTKARKAHSDAQYPNGAYIIFGKETRGIPEHVLLKHPDRCVRIPMIDEARSLNLANSVAVGTYEVLRQWGYPALEQKGELHRHRWEEAGIFSENLGK